MNATNFNQHLTYMQNLTANTLIAKAREYASDEDRLHNFKIAGPLQTRTPIGALGGFMAKHTISIYDMICGTDKGADFPLDMWEEKIKDHINYLFLLWGLVNEGRPEAFNLSAIAEQATEELFVPEYTPAPSEAVAPVERPPEWQPEPPKPEEIKKPKAPKNQWAKKPKPAIVNPEFEAAVLEMEAAHKAKIPVKEPPANEGLGELDDAKLRRKTQAALVNYFAKHGADIRPLIRATGNRVTERTLRDMLANSTAAATKHWQTVDAALKKLALEDIKRGPQE
jgi:hypothetical protein